MDGDENQHVQFFVMKQKSWNDDLKKERDMSMKSPNSTENKCAVKEVEVVAIEANIRDEKLGVYVPKEEAQDFNEVYNSFFYFAVLLHLLVFSLALPFLSKSTYNVKAVYTKKWTYQLTSRKVLALMGLSCSLISSINYADAQLRGNNNDLSHLKPFHVTDKVKQVHCPSSIFLCKTLLT